MDCLVPYQAHAPSSCSRNTRGIVDCNARVTCTNNGTLATAPSFNTSPSGTDNEECDLSQMCIYNIDCMGGIPQETRHSLALFLSSGDKATLNITRDNVNHYSNIANNLHHVPLQNICKMFNKVENSNSNPNSTTSLNVKSCCKHLNAPRCSKAPVFEIMFMRPTDVNQSNQVLVMDSRKNELHKIDVKKITRFGEGFASCAVYMKECPYIMVSGGCGKTAHTLQKYDVVENKWTLCDAMINPRTKHGMAFVNKCVFIIGGKRCASIEKYSIDNNMCSDIGTLPVSVHSPAVAVYGDKIYIFGGKTHRGNVACVQCLDTRTNKVCRLDDLPFECSGGQVIVVKDAIYFATNHGHMIKFYPDSGQSQLCSQQPYKRKHFVMFQRNNQLNIFGGIRTEGPCSTDEPSKHVNIMHRYCPESDIWTFEHSYNSSVPIYTSCTVRYVKECPVKPFMKLFGYC